MVYGHSPLDSGSTADSRPSDNSSGDDNRNGESHSIKNRKLLKKSSEAPETFLDPHVKAITPNAFGVD